MFYYIYFLSLFSPLFFFIFIYSQAFQNFGAWWLWLLSLLCSTIIFIEEKKSWIAVVVSAINFFPVKGETSECSLTIMFKCRHVMFCHCRKHCIYHKWTSGFNMKSKGMESKDKIMWQCIREVKCEQGLTTGIWYKGYQNRRTKMRIPQWPNGQQVKVANHYSVDGFPGGRGEYGFAFQF